MIEINLIPDVKQELIKAQRTRAAVISASIIASIVAGSVVVLLVLYVFGVQTVRSSYLDGQIKEGASDLAEVEDLSKILTIQNQLAKVDALHADKNISSRMFDVLAAVTPTGDNRAEFSQVTVNAEEGTIRLEGQTRGYDTMEIFKKTLSNAIFEYSLEGETQTIQLASDISTSDVSFGEDAESRRVLRFMVTFKYAEELFSPSVNAPVFKLSIDGNVTDSYLGIPRALFTERARDVE